MVSRSASEFRIFIPFYDLCDVEKLWFNFGFIETYWCSIRFLKYMALPRFLCIDDGFGEYTQLTFTCFYLYAPPSQPCSF